jgi:cellulose synthase/poly-beta-1,6-N-acetylglucosamine synthase-like glycosyltransferase
MVATMVFWSTALLLAYTYAGYPAALLALARWRPRPVTREPLDTTVSAVMTVYNGAPDIARKLENLLALDWPAGALNIVVVCDGCSDDSAAIARTFAARGVAVIESPQRRGKSACVNDGIAIADGELLLMTDVRQRVERDALKALAANFADPNVGVVGGELRFEDATTGFAAGLNAYWRYETAIRSAESASGSVVGVSGALYAMRRSAFEPLPEGTVLDDVLVPMRAVREGYRVILEPTAIAWDQASASSTQEQRRKIRTLAGNFQLVQLAPWLLVPGVNPLWLRFVSHKLLRLASPWLLIAMGLAAVALFHEHRFYRLCVLAMIAAIVAMIAARQSPRVAESAPVRLLLAFVHMNLYAAQALFAYVRNRRLHLW